jgi:trehalose 6-phosphate synthase
VHIDVTRAEAVQSAHRGAAIRLREELGGQPLIISVDRLDYSKGLRRRFLAFEHFLSNYSGKRVVFLQIAPPSRSDVETYREIRHDLEAEAGRINGRFADLDWVPLRYLNRSFLRSALMPLFAQARIGLVTPLRDGMNLVAKEFVAAQDPNDPGILVLSQFAGAAAELTAALIVNPYDEAAVAAALEQGLVMGLEERRARHAAMLDVMRRNSLEAWRDRFLSDLMMV